MPNHFLTVGLCSRDYSRLQESGKEYYPKDFFDSLKNINLCKLVCPRPEELAGIVCSTTPSRFRHKETGEWSKDSNGYYLDDQWEEVVLTQEELSELIIKYGAANWYDWQRYNWGTKWGTYDTKVHILGGDGSPILIEFQSAWCPPSPLIMGKIERYLCDTYFLKNFCWIGHDPCDASTVSISIDFGNINNFEV